MKNRFQFPKTTVLVITLLYLAVFPFVYFNFSTQGCRDQLLISAGIAFLLQLVLQRFNHITNKKIVVLLTLFISASLFGGILFRIISLNALCA